MHIMASSAHTAPLPSHAPLPATHYHVAAGAMVLHFFVDNYMPTLGHWELRVLMLSDRYVIMPILHFIERRLRERMHIAWQYWFSIKCLVQRQPFSQRMQEYYRRGRLQTRPLPVPPNEVQEAEDIIRFGMDYWTWRRRWGRFRTSITRMKDILRE